MPTPQCPRCAYDLSGIIESWADTCPLSGLCSECGLSFDWRDILSSKRRLPRWSFEHAPRSRRISTFFSTLLRAFIPPRLWRSLRLEMEIVPGRLWAFALLGNLLLKALGALALGPLLLAVWYVGANTWSIPSHPEQALLVAWPYREYGPASWDGYAVSAWLLLPFLTYLLIPPAFFLLPVSLRRAKVRRAHIARIQAYTIALLVPVLGIWSLLHTALVALREFHPGLAWEWGLAYYEAGHRIGVTTASLTGAWLLWAWHAAVKRYLRLPHALPVALATLTIAALTAATAVVLLYGHALFF